MPGRPSAARPLMTRNGERGTDNALLNFSSEFVWVGCRSRYSVREYCRTARLFFPAGVAELVYAADLGSAAERLRGSSPLSRTLVRPAEILRSGISPLGGGPPPRQSTTRRYTCRPPPSAGLSSRLAQRAVS